MPDWDPLFVTRSPMFAPLRGIAAGFSAAAWPAPQDLNKHAAQRGVRSGGGRPLRFAAMSGVAAADYELCIHDAGTVPLRTANWHDLFNACVWLAFARIKAALNRAHAAQLRAQPARAAGQRGPRRDALTLFDETGVLVLSSDAAVLARLRTFAWKQVFWDERETLLRSTRFLLFGHGLYEKALAPYVGMTGHALLLDAPSGFTDAAGDELLALADDTAARVVAARLAQPRDLAPLPVLGVPGWWPANQDAVFYDNAGYFRPGRGRVPV